MAKGIQPKKNTKTPDGSREFAFMLFMQRVSQNDIAERVGRSIQTISQWKKDDQWEVKRAAKTISMDELIVKALGKINTMLSADDFNADAFAKAVAQLKTLKQRNTVDDEIMCFMDFQNWIIERRNVEGVTEDFIKKLTRLQDSFIQFRMGNR
jgi:transcriptional regulator with XRE-family HTH domain